MLTNDPKLTRKGLAVAEQADAVYLSPISLFEISQKVRVGKWPEMAPYLPQLPDLIAEQGVLMAPFGPDVAIMAGAMPWDHRDPFDRILAATAIVSGAVLISADTAFDTLPSGHVQRVWT